MSTQPSPNFGAMNLSSAVDVERFSETKQYLEERAIIEKEL